MKKTWLLVLALAVVVCLPLTAQAKTEFTLGGYIRLDGVWNSQQGIGHSLAAYSVRSNVANANHGRFQMNANATRFNFTIKGPEVWGGKVTGFIEVDFDGGDGTNVARNAAGTQVSWVAANESSFNQAKLRLRHAMFKMAWSDREIIFGQFWSINSEMIPEVADSGAYCLYGATQLRLPQVRYTHIFKPFSLSVAICAPQNGRWGLNIDAINANEGELSEMPMFEVKARYEEDLYGKAAWYGNPRGFYVGIGGGYFRSSNLAANWNNTTTAAAALNTAQWATLGQDNYVNPFGPIANATFRLNVPVNKYHDHWLILIENFTPIIPTTTKNLAGTLGLAHQWWVGQGVSAWRIDLPGSDRFYAFSGFNAGQSTAVTRVFDYNLNFIKRYGGWVQLQYYWTNEIFTNLNFGFEKAFGFNQQRDDFLRINMPNSAGFVYANPLGYDPIESAWRASITQWYRPVPAVKFALQYAYMRTNYFQFTTVNTRRADYGQNHSLFANAWYLF